MRWHHPERGLLYPDQFLPLVRHYALMHAMTDLVVQRALEDAAVWHRAATGCRWPSTCFLPPWLTWISPPAWTTPWADRD